MAERQSIDFGVGDDSGYWWLAPRDLGGHSLQTFIASEAEPEADLIKRGLLLPVAMYEDGCGASLRLVLGELSEREAEDWVARRSWKLDLRCGSLLTGAGWDSDSYSDIDLDDPISFPDADDAYPSLFCTAVPPDWYRVDIYSYPPIDMTAGWESIVDEETWIWAGRHPEAEPAEAYFARTRPGEAPPPWLRRSPDYDINRYLMYLIRLSPLSDTDAGLVQPQLQDWEFRKPARFPLGIDNWQPAGRQREQAGPILLGPIKRQEAE